MQAKLRLRSLSLNSTKVFVGSYVVLFGAVKFANFDEQVVDVARVLSWAHIALTFAIVHRVASFLRTQGVNCFRQIPCNHNLMTMIRACGVAALWCMGLYAESVLLGLAAAAILTMTSYATVRS